MDRWGSKGSRLARKYQSGCACAVGLTEPVANGRRKGLRQDSVVKAAMSPHELISSSGDRIRRGQRKDSDEKLQRRPRQASVTDLSCGVHRPKSTGSHGHGHGLGLGLGLGCRTVAELGDESYAKIRMRRTVREEESAEAVVNQKFIDGEKSKQFMEALCVMNSNKALFVKLLDDPNSFLAKHIRELRESRENGRKSEAVSELEMVKDKGVGTVSPRKLKVWEKLLPRRGAKSCEIVVLKPGMENKHAGGDGGSDFGSNGGSGHGIQVVRQSRFPFGSLRKISKQGMGVNREHSGVEAAKLTDVPSDECKGLDRESFVRRLNREDQVKVVSNVGLAEVAAAVDDSTSMEPDDEHQLPQTSEESKNTARSPDLAVNKIDELERDEIAERILQDVRRDQTASSSSDDSFSNSFSNSTEQSETSADDGPDEEHESPVSVLDHHVSSPIDAPPKQSAATSDKLVRAAELMKSILTSSDLSWDTILPNYYSPNQLLRETESSLHESGIDARLLRDYTSEVLSEVMQYRWRWYQQGLVVVDRDVASEAMARMDLNLPRAEDSNASDCIITRDVMMRKWSSWMRLWEETDEIVVELTGKIVEDVVDEMM